MDNRITIKSFFESVSPYKEVEVEDLKLIYYMIGGRTISANFPEIEVECPVCKGKRFFKKTNTESSYSSTDGYSLETILYTCKNCSHSQKIFTLKYKQLEPEKGAEVIPGSIIKLGEYPPFGESIPAKVITLVGKERDFFLKGRRCENQSLGIGAYAYYRRIVENQKDKLIDEIIKVCKKLGKQESLIEDLEKAKNETQFSKAVDSIKEELPTSLYIEDQNPLKLLHKAVSKGIHNMTDEECLQYAGSIRIILFELTERINAILKDSKEIHDAISVLGSL
jgi:DNA-directed RNA polymerase subunit RPC12/RpoP